MVPGRPNFGHVVAAYNVEAFMDTAEFKRTMDDFLRILRETPPAPGHDRVLFPGLPESEEEDSQGRARHPVPPRSYRVVPGHHQRAGYSVYADLAITDRTQIDQPGEVGGGVHVHAEVEDDGRGTSSSTRPLVSHVILSSSC